ncbi:hypothetical protein RN001_014065 [Aquatica leii]|uniref:Uncharacterized protein n=1 Tax=Aquatica leii TaxID=1421715 RepID=A0AAN7NX08_9COLE|nr:hypothetical protein RN001_014065 [Aquatica leii]
MSENKVGVVLGKKQEEKVENVKKSEVPDNNLTISTKLSTEQLICKTPQESPNSSIKSVKTEVVQKKTVNKLQDLYNSLLYLGISQILFGLLMAVFGALVLVHEARLANFSGGLWGGGLAIASGFTGVLASAKKGCPLKRSAQKIAHTVFLALSLICVAVSQLVLVFAATGLARDINCAYEFKEEDEILPPQSKEMFPNFPSNYLALLSNAGLLIVSGVECVCAAISAYQSSRSLCPCFRRGDEIAKKGFSFDNNDGFVDSWLGKQSPPLYIVAATSTTGKRSRLPVGPIIPLPPPPPILGYPLIPAPLGPIPSPLIHPFTNEMLYHKHKRHHMIEHQRLHVPVRKPRKNRSKSKSKEKQITTEDVVRTYTGLDRTIAEEFIDICESRNTSLSSDVSCQSSCHSSSCTCASNSNNCNNTS